MKIKTFRITIYALIGSALLLNLIITLKVSNKNFSDIQYVSSVEYGQSEGNAIYWAETETTQGTAAECWCDPGGCYLVWCPITVYWTVCYSGGSQPCEPIVDEGATNPNTCYPHPSGASC